MLSLLQITPTIVVALPGDVMEAAAAVNVTELDDAIKKPP